jgi:hypothetical protein
MSCGRRFIALSSVWKGVPSMNHDEGTWTIGRFVFEEQWSDPLKTALDALASLKERLLFELAQYEKFVVDKGDSSRQLRVIWTREWLDEDGAKMLEDIESMIMSCDPTRGKDIGETIKIHMSLAELAKKRDMELVENWDMIWQWVEETLPALKSMLQELCQREHESLPE